MRLNEKDRARYLSMVKPLYEAAAESYDMDYDTFKKGMDFKKFVESYRCRICKTHLTLDNFGGVGENHMIFCKGCSATV